MKNKALIIGSSKEERQRIAGELAFEGYGADETENGCEIMNHTWNGTGYNFVICDWNLPILNPLELLGLALSKQVINDSTVLFICVEDSETDIYCLNLLNKIHILKKPISVTEILNFLKN